MNGDERRFTALWLTVLIVVCLTGIVTWGVMHKVKKGILEPANPHIVDIMAVPQTKAKQ